MRPRYSELSEGDQTHFVDLFFLPKAPYDHSFKRFSFPFLVFPLMRDKAKPELDPDSIQLIDFVKRAAGMGVRYIELTKGFKIDDETFDRLSQLADQLYKQTGVVVRWNFAFFRNADAKKNAELAVSLLTQLERKPSQVVVGVDLLANEETSPALEAGQQSYAPIEAAALGRSDKFHTRLHRTFHAGELGLSENVRDAIIFGAERVGHGVHLNDDPVTLEQARQMKLGVEVAPISNLRLRVVKNLKEHPFLKFLRLGLRVSLATDDEGVLETDMNKECAKVVMDTDVTYDELKQMADNSIDTAFVNDEQKQKLRTWLDSSFAEFERKRDF
jgi:adenosine deaminase CECR1